MPKEPTTLKLGKGMRTIPLDHDGKSQVVHHIEINLTSEQVESVMASLRLHDKALHDLLGDYAYRGFSRPRGWTIRFTD